MIAPPGNQKCKMRRLYEALDDGSQQALAAWVDHGARCHKIAGLLADDGHRIGLSTVDRHLNGVCPCDGPGDPLYRAARL